MTTHLPTANYPRFHLEFPVTDLGQARRFYGDFLGCAEGRSSDEWVDFDFHGHQIVAHKVAVAQMAEARSEVDGHSVPVRHFGVILDLPAWEALAVRLTGAGTKFIVEPYVRFKGLPGSLRVHWHRELPQAPIKRRLRNTATASPTRHR